ncbi:MAG TPA: hypothetical protein VK563_12430 [Puia sp.]|nr:hypothetical protein [Puia sp.]
MKKIILSLATVLMIGLSAFADKGTEVNQQAVRAFSKDFASAKNAVWEQKRDYVKVTFSFNEQVLFAYYNNSGELQAVVRNILSDQLPISLLTQLKKEYSGFWISELFEMASDDQTTWYVTLENADKTLVLKSSGVSNWGVYSKTKKEVE